MKLSSFMEALCGYVSVSKLNYSAATKIARSVGAPIVMFVALLALSGCPSTPAEVVDPGIAFSPADVTVAQLSTVSVRVDNPAGSAVSFASDLPEDLTHIRITTGPCPAGTGVSTSCRVWSITPGSDSITGLYVLNAHPIGGSATASLRIKVTPEPLVRTPPVVLAVTTEATSGLASSSDVHQMVIDNTGTLWAWGNNTGAQIYPGAYRVGPTLDTINPLSVSTPYRYAMGGWTDIAVVNPGSVRLVDPGPQSETAFSLGIKDGVVHSWGSNRFGQLGRPTATLYSTDASPVVGITRGGNVLGLATSPHAPTVMARTAGGVVFVWGDQRVPDPPSLDNRAHEVIELTRVGLIADVALNYADAHHVLAVRTDHTVWAYGDNNRGELGTGTIEPHSDPVQVLTDANTPLIDVARVAAGANYSLALTTTGEVYAWGANDRGQLGDGSREQRVFAQRVTGLNGRVRQISTDGESTSFALLEDGTVWMWGLIRVNNSRESLLSPVRVVSPTTFQSISGYLAIGNDCGTSGTLWRFGVPDGTTTPRAERVTEVDGCSPTPARPSLFLSMSGNEGDGSVRMDPFGIHCAATCAHAFDPNTQLTLVGVDGATHRFQSWSGCDSMSGNRCTVNMFADRVVEAIFAPIVITPPPSTFQLVTYLNGNEGDGSVFSVAPGISCPGDCVENYPSGSVVTLRAVDGELHRFLSWTGCDTSSGNECTVTMNRGRTVTADYSRTPR
jgi:alpha-tubulin suppressor-like RCC1 family protein